MCGINGIFAYHYAANPIDRSELERTRDYMASRGPDGKGAWIAPDERVGLGHRRLAIIDLSDQAAQPMSNAGATHVVTFNGEIYNYRQLRERLERAGHKFRSLSDTEVLLHLYAEKGEAMVHDLRGMFAFALWDAPRNKLFLARDPYGIKPLYYADDGWTFRFASQVKALTGAGAVSPEADPAGLVGFYLFGCVPEPFTIKRDVRALPAGSTLTVGSIGPEAAKRYHSVAAHFCEAEAQRAPPSLDALRNALQDSVGAHLVSDVPVGAFLSAGVDSGALVGLMRDCGARDIQTVTIGFSEFAGDTRDETVLARKIADLYGTHHTTRIVTREEFESDLPRIIEAMDQPSIDGINTWFASKAAAELGLKVVISGLGGDELFGGYPSFRDIPRWVAALRAPGRIPLLGSAVRKLLDPMTGVLGLNPKAAGMLELGGSYPGAYLLRRGLYMPWEIRDIVEPGLVREGLRRLQPLRLIEQQLEPEPGSAFGRVATLESSLYMRNQLLRDTDWASMAHALEVRVPLVDSVLLSQVCPIISGLPLGEGKRLLAAAPSRPLPEAVTARAKTGFTTPVQSWMREATATRIRPRPAGGSQLPVSAWARDWSRIVRDMQQSRA